MTATQQVARGPYSVRSHGERWAVTGPDSTYTVLSDFGSALSACEALNREHALRNGGEYEPLSRVELIDHGRELCRLAGARAVGHLRAMLNNGEVDGPMVESARAIVSQWDEGMKQRQEAIR